MDQHDQDVGLVSPPPLDVSELWLQQGNSECSPSVLQVWV